MVEELDWCINITAVILQVLYQVHSDFDSDAIRLWIYLRYSETLQTSLWLNPA